MKLFKAVTLFVLFSAALSGPAAAQSPVNPGNMPPPGPPSILNLAAELDFTPAQVIKLMAIEKNSRKLMEKIITEFKKLMGRMRDEMDSETPDQTKINALIDKMSANNSAMLHARTEDMLAIKAVLTKEQREKMKKFFHKMPMGGRPPGGPMSCNPPWAGHENLGPDSGNFMPPNS